MNSIGASDLPELGDFTNGSNLLLSAPLATQLDVSIGVIQPLLKNFGTKNRKDAKVLLTNI